LPVAGELVVEGRKLVGSAQVRDGNSLLQHGSILVDDDQYLLAELLASVDVVTPAATLHALTGRKVTIEEFAGALARAVGAVDGSEPRPMELDDSLLDDVRSLVRTRYAVADWTWRR
jgi:lipoate-protein ligase A